MTGEFALAFIVVKPRNTVMGSLEIQPRRTSMDRVFDKLCEEINSLKLRPGAKISEVEIASRFKVSRQPVRDAFSRLENIDLLLIRPQKATVVKKFSNMAITKSRFVRAAVEAAVLRSAAILCDESGAERLDNCLKVQQKIVGDGNFDAFSDEDYTFHKTLCEIAKLDHAFEVISTEKAKLDRLCLLSHSGGGRLSKLLEDHIGIANHIKNGRAEEAVQVGMAHLSRLDSTLEKILLDHPEYFDV